MKPADYFSRLAELLASGQHVDARLTLAIYPETPLDVIRMLVEGLPPRWALQFFDPNYPSKSDPGAYVRVMRQGTRYRLRHSNHGWTGRWQQKTLAEVVDYIYACRKHNSSLGHYDGHVELFGCAPQSS
jgi:hypothetical protein